MSRHGRLALVALLLASFTLPAAAQSSRRVESGDLGHQLGHQLARLWHQITSPFLALWGADDGGSTYDPNGGPKH